MEQSFVAHIEKSIKQNWTLPALSDYKGITYTYEDLARKIAKIHIIFEKTGIKKGDRIALVGRNSANWAVTFLAITSYGAVVVPILHEFKPDNVHHIVNHSEAMVLFVGDVIWENLNEAQMPNVKCIISVADFSILHENTPFSVRDIHAKLDSDYSLKYPKGISPDEVIYHRDKPEELGVINYTSGTSGFSKGVMLPFRSLTSNLLFAIQVLPLEPAGKMVSILPMAHAYGSAFEFIYPITRGCHINFLTRTPSPKIILDAFGELKPKVVLSVPLIIEKIYKKSVLEAISKPSIKLLLKIPLIDRRICKKINEKLTSIFGGEFYEVVIGGAALNPEVERFLKKIEFRYTVGYGMTECGPIITYDSWNTNKLYSTGKAAPGMEIKIDSDDSENLVGEILVRGENVMLGYYRNEEATTAAFTADGWMRTGDLGIIDADGYLFIKGRCKNMILGPSGQNIFPEEIEGKVNNLPFVQESLVVESNGKLIALIYPDYETADKHGLTIHDIEKKMEENRIETNKDLPAYSQISSVKLYPEEFEKTPKRSIKRFLYQPQVQ
ncbi:AMP-binding protein [Williamwhitmania taraxaci]|uniref:Long-chain acyl-CoA synthetase n=1 Tax=Williamwhitmania taraxaci TaxID=1640674 RepID=A0A1G6KZ18_9BACT|nr:AMP-binding protein [Williamwhitmania taraxaci]SDC36369.1 long-chain acyl-CoA synthetase [Williamwhitmania taraxaci]